MIYAVTRTFPDDERFGLTAQLRRAAVSISSNIAEGSSRTSQRDFARFVELAYGSLMETISQLCIAERQKLVSVERAQEIRLQAERIARMLSGLKSKLRSGND